MPSDDELWIALFLAVVAVFAAALNGTYTASGPWGTDGVTIVTRVGFGLAAMYLGASALYIQTRTGA